MTHTTTLAKQYRQQVVDELPPHVLRARLDATPRSNVTRLVAELKLLSQRQLDITGLDAVDLLAQIAARTYTSEEVVIAFAYRAAYAHRLTCCLTGMWLDKAVQRARELDHYLEKHGTTIGPLHGLPISVKDQFEVQGRITSLSYLSKHVLAKPSPKSCSFVTLLEPLGAITYVHTNLPQTIMHLESSSFWGTVLNPYNTSLTAGGSSGGESALIAMRGSVLGLGTDIGGSVRPPAANCGLWSLRPTSSRLPSATAAVPGRHSIIGTAGPIATSLRDLDLFLSLVLAEETRVWRRDASLLEMAWGVGRKGAWEGGSRKLRIGVMWDDGEVRPTRPIRRTLEGAVQRLTESELVEVVDFEPWKMREGWEITRQLYFADGGKRIRDLLDESEVAEPLKPLTKWLLEDAGTEPLKDHSVHELWELNIKRENYRSAFREHWNNSGVDVVLSPVAPNPPPRHGEAKWWSYTSHWNFADHPALVFPTGLFVDATIDVEPTVPRDEWKNEDERFVHEHYSPEIYANAPLGLQLVARKYHDEEVIAAMRVIEGILFHKQVQ
ncbi:hypothetical protein MVLG_03789 [Microbotryum lychnidis-dioicae p1A1 Lamole]|uniref:amidase n=1 Tax=Microbotryum lychnidis-dioicae (strain p1A1 Lamole / MvSl-1064) TaxID=683840 RepID=U5H997_USTV1|nr:hypothetical protein MVLG_03789 [Microbotryum lychnidis-dioicae p1A1 Lamole]|eukprot:KDE05846.1 hypothetical protein MVLG_03789 [Microbotryum lychnidis-dioicae p1A1 Lamole]